jgi:hypothetical protein
MSTVPLTWEEKRDAVFAGLPKAIAHKWSGQFGERPTTWTIYPNDDIFHAISAECATESEAWDSAYSRLFPDAQPEAREDKDASDADVRVVRPMGGSILGQEESHPLPIPAADVRTKNPTPQVEVAGSVSPVLLRELRQAAMKATPGPWKSVTNDEFSGSKTYPHMVMLDYGVGPVAPNVVCSRMNAEDSEFVALANPQTILALLDRLATNRKDVLTEALETVRKVYNATPTGEYHSCSDNRKRGITEAEQAITALLAEPKASTPKGE